MPSITGDACAVPCFRNSHRSISIEAGTRLVGEIPSAYCALTYLKGSTPKIIGTASDDWDELLIKLKEIEPNVAHLLLSRLPALNDPCGTIIKLMDHNVLDVTMIPTQPIAYVKVWCSHPQVDRINEILLHYGWLTCIEKRADNYDYFYYDGDIPASQVEPD